MLTVVYLALAVLAIWCAIGVLVSRHPFQSAMFLLGTLALMAALFVIQGAQFVAAIQILVYGGGILVLYIFVLMFTDTRAVYIQRQAHGQKWLAVALGLVVFFAIGHKMYHQDYEADVAALGTHHIMPAVEIQPASDGETEPVVAQTMPPWQEEQLRFKEPELNYGPVKQTSWRLFRDFVFPFEVASILLTVAVISAIFLAQKEA